MASRTPVAAVLAAILVLGPPGAAGQEDWHWSGVPRIVAVGDVHGAYDALADLLRTTGVVDEDLRWRAGDAHLVSLGDLVDRGPDSRAVMDLLMRLQAEAEAAGGQVHVVLGNHELMNLIGDLRYVAPAEFAAFADDAAAAAARDAAYARFVSEQAEAGGENTPRALFDERYPPGYFGHRIAFAADGKYGSWLLTLPSLVVINGTAFVHGGLSELVARSGTAVNRRVQETLSRYLGLRRRLVEAGILPAYDMERDLELARSTLEDVAGTASAPRAALEEFIELADAPVLGPEGPHWYRGSVYCNSLLEEPVLDAALERIGASSVVVGHTPTPNRRVRELYGGRLVMADTGMLAEYYAGRPAALVLAGGERFVQYLAPAERLATERGRALAYGLTEPELRAALLNASIESIEASENGMPAQVTLRLDEAMIEAAFYPRGRDDAAEHELAAFALDRLLGLDLVPPTVPRELDGEPGALQLRFADGVSEAERRERRLPFGWCPIEPQLQLMFAFDILILNPGRDADTVRYRNELSNLTLVGHDEAFGTRRRLPPDVTEPTVPAALTEALRRLDEETLEAALGEWLDGRQISALLARRDELIDLL